MDANGRWVEPYPLEPDFEVWLVYYPSLSEPQIYRKLFSAPKILRLPSLETQS